MNWFTAPIMAGLLFLSCGCEEKAVPVDDEPASLPKKEHQQGYIDTH